MRHFALICMPILAAGRSRLLQDWSYEDMASWAEVFETCGGEQQSPIDIPTSGAFNIENFASPASFEFEFSSGSNVYDFENLGTTVELHATDRGLGLGGDVSLLPVMIGRTDNDDNAYTLEQIHFHWGPDTQTGSEHSWDGQYFPIEMHLVHYNSAKYSSFTEATGFEDGLLVVAVFFEVTDSEEVVDAAMEPLVTVMQSETFVDDTEEEVDIDLEVLVETIDVSKFFLYPGSLTTPACNEIVTWVIMKDTLKISSDVLSAFQNVIAEEGQAIHPNFREVQDGNARPIYDSESNMYSVLAQVQDRNWNYTSFTEDMWTRVFPSCGGNQQSPIDLPAGEVFEITMDEVVGDFEFAYDVEMEVVEFENLGTTVELIYHDEGLALVDAGKFLSLMGRELTEDNNNFVLEQAHFHWGLTDDAGSEHTVGGEHFPMEMHLVHYNTKYDNFSLAAGFSDGLLVVGVFFDISENEDTTVDDIIEPLRDVMAQRADSFIEGAEVALTDFSIDELVSNIDTSRFFSYAGSLTTPGCGEVVTWIVMRDPLTLSRDFMTAFRETNVMFGQAIANNYRYVQDGNGRLVFESPENAFAFIGQAPSAGRKLFQVSYTLLFVSFAGLFLNA